MTAALMGIASTAPRARPIAVVMMSVDWIAPSNPIQMRPKRCQVTNHLDNAGARRSTLHQKSHSNPQTSSQVTLGPTRDPRRIPVNTSATEIEDVTGHRPAANARPKPRSGSSKPSS